MYTPYFPSLGRNTHASVTISSADYLPGMYNLTIDSTDIYGQTVTTREEIEVTGSKFTYSELK